MGFESFDSRGKGRSIVMHGIQLVQDLALILAAAAVATVICQRLKQPVVLGYILVGMIIGPHTPPFSFVSNEEEIRTLAELGVVLLMFSVGLHFSFRKLKEVGFAAVVAAVFEIVGMFILGERLGQLFGWSAMDSIFLGAILSISSTTIIAKVLEEMGMLRPGFARLVFGILVVEDILAIAMMGMLTSLGTTGEVSWVSTGHTLLKLATFFVSVAVVGFLLVPRIIHLASRTRMDEVLLITVLGMTFGVALLAEKLGFSVALGAFLVGAVLAEVREVYRIEKLVAPVRDLFSAIFFISSGMLIKFDLFPDALGQVVLIAGTVIFGKILFSGLGAFLGGCDLRTAVRAGMSLAQIGEFSFIIAGLGLSLRATGDKLYSLAVLVSAVTTLTTPYLISWSNPVADWLEQKCPRWLMDIGRVYQNWLRSVQSNPNAPHRSARMFVRKLVGQLGMQLALITAPILGAAGFWEAYGNRFPEGFRMAWWGGPMIWLGGAILALPVVVAFLRKYYALGMLVSEIIFPHRKGDQGVDPARTWATLLFCGIGYTVFGFYLVLISSPLLPAGKILWVFLGILTLITLGSRKKLVELYSKGQSSIRNTWDTLPDQEQVILPGNSEVRAYRIGESSIFVGNTLQETGLRTKSGVVVVAIERQSGNVVSPGPEEKLFANDEIFVFGEEEQLIRAEEFFSSRGVTAV